MGYESKFAKSFSRAEPQKLGFSAIAVCFLISLLYFSFFDPYVNPSNILRFPAASINPPDTHVANDTNIPQETDGMQENKVNAPAFPPRKIGILGGQNETLKQNSSTIIQIRNSTKQAGLDSRHSSTKNGTHTLESVCDDSKSDGSCQFNANYRSSFPQNSSVDNTSSPQTGNGSNLALEISEGLTKELKPVCDVSDPRADVCEIDGEVWIQGSTSSSVFYYAPYANDSWKIRPYARKRDKFLMNHIKEVLVKPSMTHEGPHQCNVNHSVPAIVFSVIGYTGNFFHDFTDVIIPLFLTSRQYNGEVQFFVTGMNAWWINKYKLILNRLSKYDIIDFNQDDRTHCFRHAIVGLRSHKELTIIPSKSPNGYSMVHFAEFMRTTFSLKRDSAITIKEHMKEKKPRLLIISRKRTRRFRNLDEIVHMAKSLGYDVIAAEADVLAKFSNLVNSCDVLMGVHGAGLTNLLFLPMNAVLIQIVPLGGLRWMSRIDFGDPAKDMNLKYLEYQIKEEESSLIEEYPRDHAVFKDPRSLTKNGWNTTKEIFLVKQDVRVDVNRFRGVLMEALKLLHN